MAGHDDHGRIVVSIGSMSSEDVEVVGIACERAQPVSSGLSVDLLLSPIVDLVFNLAIAAKNSTKNSTK